VFVNSAWPASWGGGEKWTVEAAEWFRERGDDVTVIGRPNSKLLDAARGRNLPTVEHRFGGDFDPVAIYAAHQRLRESQAELVVVNFNKEAWQFGLAAKRLKIPVIARHGFPLLRNTFHHRQLASSILSRLVVNAQAIKDEYANLGFNVGAVKVIHNGVKLVPQNKGELRRRFDLSPDRFLILAAGRIESQKRFERVLDIAQALVPSHPNLQCLIAGEGPMRSPLEEESKARGLSAHVRFLGFVPDLAEILGDADLFLLTSEIEGTPNVLLEAMAAEVACVAFRVGAVPEIMTGQLAANCILKNDVFAMTGRAKELIVDKKVRNTVAALEKARVADEFDFNHSMQRFAALFDETASAKS
jgi:glycosyltransferase involved in cell wall biosynthesis